jgi:hypothetical protein
MFDELDPQFVRYFATMLKVIIITCVTVITVVTFSGSYWRAIWIALAVFVLSLFNVWRRLLEPLCLVAFVAVVIFDCAEPGSFMKFRLALGL